MRNDLSVSRRQPSARIIKDRLITYRPFSAALWVEDAINCNMNPRYFILPESAVQSGLLLACDKPVFPRPTHIGLTWRQTEAIIIELMMRERVCLVVGPDSFWLSAKTRRQAFANLRWARSAGPVRWDRYRPRLCVVRE